jgi:hypothetical protein
MMMLCVDSEILSLPPIEKDLRFLNYQSDTNHKVGMNSHFQQSYKIK